MVMTMNKSLMLLANEAHALKTIIIENDGELTQEIEEALMVSSHSLAKKSDSYKYIMDDFTKYSELLKEKENQLKKVRQAMENAVDRLRNNIKQAMIVAEMDQISGDEYVFKLSNSKSSLVISDESLVPKEFKYQVISEAIDKEKILEELKISGSVYGVQLKENKALKITINKGLK